MTPPTGRPFGYIALTLFLTSLASTASAQQGTPLDRTFSPQLFHPAVGPDEFLSTEAAMPLAHLNYSMGLWLNYSRNSLTIYPVDPSSNTVGKAVASPLRDALSADLVFAIGLWDRLQVGIGVPMTVFQTGDDFHYIDNGQPGTVPRANGFGLGDHWFDI